MPLEYSYSRPRPSREGQFPPFAATDPFTHSASSSPVVPIQAIPSDGFRPGAYYLTTSEAKRMIDQVLSAVVNRLNTDIGTLDPEVVLGNISLIDAFQSGSSQNLNDKVIASVVNIEQEEALRNLPVRRTTTAAGGLPQAIERAPEIYLNVYVLFGANKSNYTIALQRISQVIAFFQRQFVFTPADLPVLGPLNLSKLIFDLYSTGFDELNQLWSVMGGKYIPSVIYKMRLGVIQDAPEASTEIISEVRLRSGTLATLSEGT
jgi:hypothetical protein